MMTYTKYIKYGYYLILLVSVALTIVFFLNTSNYSNPPQAFDFTFLDIYLGWGYFLLFLNVIAMMLLPLPFMTKASYKRLGFIAIIFAVLFVVSYAMASGDPVNAVVKVQPSENALKLTDTGLIFTYILFGIALIAILFSSLYKSVILPRLTR